MTRLGDVWFVAALAFFRIVSGVDTLCCEEEEVRLN